jgi:membrane-associated phospholipid phosphatase
MSFVIVIDRWKEALRNPGFRCRIAVTLMALVAVLMALKSFLGWNETRPGKILSDPILTLFSPVDLTWLTFLLVYGGVIGALILLARDPERLLRAIQGYVLVILLRIVTILLFPLEPPPSMIPLQDPIVQFLGGMTSTPNKDLLFSGHTATMFLLYLNVSGRRTRQVFLVGTIAVAVSLLLQHVHYTIDVIVALFIAYAAYRIVACLNRRFF